jgi:hypothetical protein
MPPGAYQAFHSAPGSRPLSTLSQYIALISAQRKITKIRHEKVTT